MRYRFRAFFGGFKDGSNRRSRGALFAMIVLTGIVISAGCGSAHSTTTTTRKTPPLTEEIFNPTEGVLIGAWKETAGDGNVISTSLYQLPVYPELVRIERVGDGPPKTMMGDQILVSFTNTVTSSNVQAALGPSFSVRQVRSLSGLWIIGFTNSASNTVYQTVAKARNLLSHLPVKSVSADSILTVCATTTGTTDGGAAGAPIAPAPNPQWALAKVSAPSAWSDAGTLLRAPVVAVVDTGVAFAHPALATTFWTNQVELEGTTGVDDDGNGYIDDIHGWDFTRNTNNPDDNSRASHGTRCAGIIAAVPVSTEGMSGISPNARILSLKCFGETGAGPISSVTEALAYARAMHVDVINCSWAIRSNEVDNIGPLRIEIEENLSTNDIILVAASGDQNSDVLGTQTYPACAQSSKKITVLATDEIDAAYPSSNFGLAIQLGAPGVLVLSTRKATTTSPNLYSEATGSSFATAHVSGAAAFLKSALANPSAENVIRGLTNGADTLTVTSPIAWSNKRLNLKGALTPPSL